MSESIEFYPDDPIRRALEWAEALQPGVRVVVEAIPEMEFALSKVELMSDGSYRTQVVALPSDPAWGIE